jgi:hypothetical protein
VPFFKEQLLKTGYIEDNQYLDLYTKLINDNLQTACEKFKTQQHHSIPCACYASRAEANKDPLNLKVNLLFKDHIIAHYYLCLCAKTSQFRYKMIAAIEFTLGKSMNITNQEIVAALQEWLRADQEFQAAYEEYTKIRAERLSSPEAREKARQKLIGHATSEITRQKISKANRGRHLSEETRAKLSVSHKGRAAWNKGKPANTLGRKVIYHPETLTVKYVLPEQLDVCLADGWLIGNPKVRGRSTGTRSRSIRCLETGEMFEMIKSAEEATGIGSTSLLQCLKGRSKTAGGYHWEYV